LFLRHTVAEPQHLSRLATSFETALQKRLTNYS